MRRVLFIFAVLLLLAGCWPAESSMPANSTSRPTDGRQGSASTPGYWYSQPATASVSSADFQKLWDACAETARANQYLIDRIDYRQGILTTQPEVSQGWFEIWRTDTGTVAGVIQNSLQTIRRTIRYDFDRNSNGTFTAHPKVLVERLALIEPRITSVSQNIYSFTQPQSTWITDDGVTMPTRYWYAIGRDPVMEDRLAHEVESTLKNP